MKRYIVAICGGSGSGKSILAYGLQDKYPDLIEVVHFDDYQKEENEVPVTEGMRNWDVPEAINFDLLINDLETLKEGKDLEIMTKSERHNPEYKMKGRTPHKMFSKKIIIIEGYLVLWDNKVKEFFDYIIFLDLHHDIRMKRRTKFLNPEYEKKILQPMHMKHVESTKKYADLIIDIEKVGKDEMLEIAINKLKKAKIL